MLTRFRNWICPRKAGDLYILITTQTDGGTVRQVACFDNLRQAARAASRLLSPEGGSVLFADARRSIVLWVTPCEAAS
jgi:hypothetical protein